MSLVSNTYGKGRVRVLRLHKAGALNEVRELTVQAMLKGDFARAYTSKDNSTSISTDTTKNVINVVAHENLTLQNEDFCNAVADKFLTSYPQVDEIVVTAYETKWSRAVFDGKPHDHSFVLDSNGKPFVKLVASRTKRNLCSGIDGYTFMKTTQSGWDNYAKDPYTTIVETRDRIAATSMLASWTWIAKPADYAATNAKILATMLEVFATTYSESVQDSLYRMGTAALATVPEIGEVSMACPNKHYIPMNLSPFGIANKNEVFLPTDEPHGQIECMVARG